MTFFSALYHREISIEYSTFFFTVLPVQVVPSGKRRAACGELCLFRETLDEKTGYRSNARIRLRGHFAFLIFGDVSSHYNRLGVMGSAYLKRVQAWATSKLAEF